MVFIHVSFPGKTGQIIKYASMWAVPVFYMIAGYYAYGASVAGIKRKFLNIIRIFIYAYACHFLFNLLLAYRHGNVIAWLDASFNWKTPILYIVFCTIGFAIPLWYLIGMVETYIVWGVVVRRHREGSWLKLIPILFIARILMFTYCDTLGLSWSWKINFLTCSMLWFLMGYFFHTEKGKWWISLRTRYIVVMALAGMFVMIAPVAFDLKLQFSEVGSLPYAAGLFILGLKNPDVHVSRTIEYTGRRLSLDVYVFHTLIVSVIVYVAGHVGVDPANQIFGWPLPFITVICSIGFAWILDKLKNRVRYISE